MVYIPNGNSPMSLIDEDGLEKLMEWADKSPLEGDFAEVGVYRGGSAYFLYKLTEARGVKLHLFDTFTGMPYADPELDVVPVGHFGDGIDLERIQELMPKAKIYQGIFPETMPGGMDKLAFVHVDCDQYQAIKACCEQFPARMSPGGIIYFDDYTNLPGAQKAIDDGLFCIHQDKHRAIWRHQP